jgi:hypothetical protein
MKDKQTRNCLKEISKRKKNWSRVPDGGLTLRLTGRLTVGRNVTSTSIILFIGDTPCGGGIESLHRSPASRKRRRKVNPMPGGISGPPCSWEIWIRGPGPPGWGSLKIWDNKIWPWVPRDSDPSGTALARPAATVNCRPVHSSDRALQNNKPSTA